MPETDRNDCKVCRKSNNLDNMVFCPRCEEWFHYQCAGVNESVVDRSWVCGNCSILPPVDPPGQTSTPVSSIAIGPIPSSISQPASSVPSRISLPTIVPAPVDGQSILTEQARASLQWIQEQREILEREMEENYKQEMERKRLELKKLANEAMMRIIDTTKDGLANSLDDQPGAAAAGVSKVQNWMQQMVGEMKNLSVAQSFGRPEVPTTSVPMFDISSVPTTAGMNLSVFDPTSSSTLHGVPDRSAVAPTTTYPSVHLSSAAFIQSQLSNSVNPSPVPTSSVPPATMVPPQLASGAQSEFDTFGRLATTPRGLASRVPNISGLGVNTPTNVVTRGELVEKLPAQQRLDWALYKRQFVAVDLRAFATYMSTLVAAASEVTVLADTKHLRPAKVGSAKEKNFLNAHSVPEPAKKEVKEEYIPMVLCLACNGAGHKVKDCAVFKKWGPESRWKTVQDHHLCRTCLGKHGRRPCKSQACCGIEGCQQRHHQLLHTQFQKQQQPAESKPKNPSKGPVEGVNAHHTEEKSTLFRILPVRLFWKGKSVETFAFLDDGSSMTLVEQSIADRLGINDGESLPLCLTWTSDVNRQVPNSQRVSLKISGAGKEEQYALIDTRTVGNLKLPMQSLKYEDLARQYTHLRGLPIRSYDSVVPGILIGSNNAGLIASSKLREGQLGDPIGAKTRLGWTIYGYAVDREIAPNFSFHICECHEAHKTDQELHDLVKHHFSLENVGVSASQTPESDEDRRARRILEETTKRTSQGFETGLLWRTDSVDLPNSYPMAMRRLECFERRMNKDPDLQVSVQRQIKEYLENGYIHEATPHELESADPKKVWYLPLGVVKNPKKPNKIRLVWDAAAKVGGISLNTMLLKGPDMLIPLASVLCGFRQYSIAVSGDLKQMFHQFRIRPQDVHSQRFLYREHPSKPVTTFVMDVGSFGATCSPSQAQYIKNLNAKEHEAEFPEATDAIVKKHYVDDYLDSFDTEEKAIKVALDVKTVHARGGFEIRNWHSNSAALLDRVGNTKHQESKVINVGTENEAERVLGLIWMPNEDYLAFAADLKLDEVTPTKRNILRTDDY
ncbi:uncharacterized protein LOC134284260 [Aedes albopictus]|uniref:PHD-type domain-containing protein n=1 Tax=Aedes albopictus TaxID=7160 RepID=A0ABM1ZB23_AEDAL